VLQQVCVVSLVQRKHGVVIYHSLCVGFPLIIQYHKRGDIPAGISVFCARLVFSSEREDLPHRQSLSTS
jgi:hypothetical protein